MLLVCATAMSEPRWTIGPSAPGPNEYQTMVGTDSGDLILYEPSVPPTRRPRTWVRHDGSWRLCPTPDEVAGTALAYDSRRDVTVLLGDGPVAETWEFDGARWSRGPVPPSALTPRRGNALAYHSGSQTVVSFGGNGPSGYLSDTWVYDGTAWAPGPSAPAGLSPRTRAAMADLPDTGQLVLFGGFVNGDTATNDTWLYDGRRWQAGPGAPAGLEPRAGHGMSHVPNQSAVLLLGGTHWDSVWGDSWLFDGTNWTELQASSDPGDRSHFGLATAGSGVYLFGGWDFQKYYYSYSFDDLWKLDSSGWRRIDQGVPTARYDSAIAAGGGRIVLFGGSWNHPDEYGETWIYDGQVWNRGAPAPAAMGHRRGHAMTWDTTRNRAVLFGGNGQNDTWEYDTSWKPGPAAPAGLAGRWNAALAYDSSRRRCVLFGGSAATSLLNDTWEYDGTNWSPGPAPPPALLPRAGHAMAFDPTRDRVVLMGGGQYYGDPYLGDTWEYDGTAWYPGPAAPPGFVARHSHTMAFHAGRGTILLHGGVRDSSGPDVLDDFWEYDGQGWTAGPTPPSELTPRGWHVMAYEPSLARMILFGGYDGQFLRETFEERVVAESFIAGQGLAFPNRNKVRVYDPDGIATSLAFLAYGAHQWGVNVAAGEIDATTYDSILTGPGPGEVYGPHVRGFDRTGATMGRVNFYAYGSLKYGVNVNAQPVDGDGFDEILTGAGPGSVFGPHVRGWNHDATSIVAIGTINYFAYATPRYGVNVEGGDVDGDGFSEILTGAGPSPVFAPQVRGWNHDGQTISAISTINFQPYAAPRYGVNVAGGNVDGGPDDEIATAPGPGPSLPARLRGFDHDGQRITQLPGCQVTPWSTLYGARLDLANVDAGPIAELVTGPGPDPTAAASVSSHHYDGATLTELSNGFVAFTSQYGVNVAGGWLGAW